MQPFAFRSIRRPDACRRALGAALAAASLMVLPAASRAQPGQVMAQSGGGWSFPVGSTGDWQCGNGSLASGNSATAFCHGGPSSIGTPASGSTVGAYTSDFVGAAEAAATNGSLHASAVLGWFVSAGDDSHLTPRTSAFAATVAGWTDQATLSPHTGAGAAPAAFLDLTYRLTGTISANAQWTYPIFDPSGLLNGTGYIGYAGAGGTFIGSSPSGSFYDDGGVAVGSVTAPPNPIAGDYTLRVGIASLSSELFSVYLAMSAQVTIGLSTVPQGTFVGGIVADFSRSATPIGYRLVDANGGDVTAGYDVTFAQGLRIAAAPTQVVPEPATLVLVAAGVAAAALVVRRRR